MRCVLATNQVEKDKKKHMIRVETSLNKINACNVNKTLVKQSIHQVHAGDEKAMACHDHWQWHELSMVERMDSNTSWFQWPGEFQQQNKYKGLFILLVVCSQSASWKGSKLRLLEIRASLGPNTWLDCMPTPLLLWRLESYSPWSGMSMENCGGWNVTRHSLECKWKI